uniref:AlNc14C25G2519 protein n=1 Tax=Albugo laibachii Nc14 TaxID=890382 RepID=F0W6N1_9STRA|nr:AlNc14C25G2519 [Albugo laibachii Nc14]|eukprot:CCA16776.1 AlNc14C25G2519 [Albugo laibachii Nc14]
MPKITGAISQNFEILSRWKVDKKQIVLFDDQLHNINTTRCCLTTTYAQYSRKRGSCWRCLVTTYKGMVLLNRFETTHEENHEFFMLIFTNEEVKVNACSTNCGDINLSEDCMADPIHVAR